MTGDARPSPWRQFFALFGWTKHSTVLLGGFFLTILLILYVWWPLAEEVLAYVDWSGPWWRYMDWLLLGVFLFMTLTIMSRADLRTDALIVFVGTLGGLVIESWGTQTNLWFYYTAERPPLWIIPAWPIASLSIDRITRLFDFLTTKGTKGHEGKNLLVFRSVYWFIFAAFLTLMLVFVAPTFDKSYTVMATLLVVLLIATPTDHRMAVLTFAAGSALGYFLELWGTTRQCWTYYTFQTPPLFAVLAHGMAAVSFWRAGLLVKFVWGKMKRLRLRRGLQIR
jgi:hypothetical protein